MILNIWYNRYNHGIPDTDRYALLEIILAAGADPNPTQAAGLWTPLMHLCGLKNCPLRGVQLIVGPRCRSEHDGDDAQRPR